MIPATIIASADLISRVRNSRMCSMSGMRAASSAERPALPATSRATRSVVVSRLRLLARLRRVLGHVAGLRRDGPLRRHRHVVAQRLGLSLEDTAGLAQVAQRGGQALPTEEEKPEGDDQEQSLSTEQHGGAPFR